MNFQLNLYPKFFFVLKLNENGELVTSEVFKKTDSVTRQDVQEFKQLLNDNLDKFTRIV